MADPDPHHGVTPAEVEPLDWQDRFKGPNARRDGRAFLQELCREMLNGSRLLIASNRGPLAYSAAPDGGLQARRGRGGPASTLKTAYESYRVTWVACAMSDSDRAAMAAAGNNPIQSPMPDQDLRVRFVAPSKDEYHKYYNVVSNPLLWFLQHSMWNFPWTPNITEAVHEAWKKGYMSVNRLIAEAVAEEAARDGSAPFILIQDYHLYLAPYHVRHALPGAKIIHFTHIPWPDVTHWWILPCAMREAILRSLLASDIVGFQSRHCQQNFLHTCRCLLEDASVDEDNATVQLEGWTTRVRTYPVTIDLNGLKRALASPAGRSYVENFRSKCGEHTIVRIDRAEPSRNILRGFKAFDRFLQRYPQMAGKVRFLALLASSRSRVWEYQRHMEEIKKLAELVNRKHGEEGWQPIELILDSSHLENLAALSLYDVLLVNPVTDGMSVVAKEGPSANSKDGVLVLSEANGAYEQLKQGVLGICPTDLEGTAEAFYQALTLPLEKRRSMQATLRRAIEAENPLLWLYQQMRDLKNGPPSRAPEAGPESPLPQVPQEG